MEIRTVFKNTCCLYTFTNIIISGDADDGCRQFATLHSFAIIERILRHYACLIGYALVSDSGVWFDVFGDFDRVVADDFKMGIHNFVLDVIKEKSGLVDGREHHSG